MLGSHNSFTYQGAVCKPLNLFAFLWRCQGKTVREQMEEGVGYFDVRVRYDLKNKCWRTCHGMVDFGLTYGSLAVLPDGKGWRLSPADFHEVSAAAWFEAYRRDGGKRGRRKP